MFRPASPARRAVSRPNTREATRAAAGTRPPAPSGRTSREAHGSAHAGWRALRRQVFGLVGTPRRTGGPTDRRFPGRDQSPVLPDGGRAHSPLRGSPGFAPGSLLPRTRAGARVRTVGTADRRVRDAACTSLRAIPGHFLVVR